MKQCPARTTCVTEHWKLIPTMVPMTRVMIMMMTTTTTTTTMTMILGHGAREQEEMGIVTGINIVAIAWQWVV